MIEMAQIRLNSLRCLDQQESGFLSDGDEIYFTFKDNGGSGTGKTGVINGMDTGDLRNLNHSFSFNGSVKVSMYEDDLVFDDFIESKTLSTPGTYKVVFDEPGVKYELSYTIFA
jgi:hypothetical protein